MKFGRVIGFDDGYFRRPGKAPLVGVIYKGSVLEGVKITEIDVDGTDVTEKILDIVEPLAVQLSGVFLYGTVFGGTNIVDIQKIGKLLPVVVVADKRPTERFYKTFESRGKVFLLLRNPALVPLKTKKGVVYVAWSGISKGEVKRLVELYQFNSKVPEPLRVAHIFAKGVGLFLNG